MLYPDLKYKRLIHESKRPRFGEPLGHSSAQEDPILICNQSNLCLTKNACLAAPPSRNVSCNPLDEPSPLGLTLRKTPSLLELVSMSMVQGHANEFAVKTNVTESLQTGHIYAPPKEKLKASNFPATALKIGSWECLSRYEGGLVAKCYYGKGIFAWEVLENGLKSKIEIQWSDICAIKAKFPEDEPASLEVEVSKPPLFFREINPQPKKRTLWKGTSDFTGGEATFCRTHLLQFPEGVLNKPYEKLLRCNYRLNVLASDGYASSAALSDGCTYNKMEIPLQQVDLQNSKITCASSQVRNEDDQVQIAQASMALKHTAVVPELVVPMPASLRPSLNSVGDTRSQENGNSNEHLIVKHCEPIFNYRVMEGNTNTSDEKMVLDEASQAVLDALLLPVSSQLLAEEVPAMTTTLARYMHQLQEYALSDCLLTSDLDLGFLSTYPWNSCQDDKSDPLQDINLRPNAWQSSGLWETNCEPCLRPNGSTEDLLLNLPRVASFSQFF